MAGKKFYLGLDIGTNSVGFCVTDENYDIIKKHKTVYDGEKTKYYGNHVWGSRLFDEAQDASSRRSAREKRRRLQRRRQRIVLLQQLFAPEMEKVDPYFFDRLNNSAIHLEDRNELLRQKHLLFNGNDYTDKDFFKKYPTIYHLRKARMDHPETKFDIREIYLALAHRIKYRGNFLHEGERTSIGSDPETIVSSFNAIDSTLEDIREEEENFTVSSYGCSLDRAKELLEKFKTINKIGERYDVLVSVFKLNGLKSTDPKRQRLALIAGSSKSLSQLFPEIEFEEERGKQKVDFSSEDFADKVIPGCSSAIGDSRVRLLLKLKELYDLRILARLLNGKATVSEARVDIYEKHKEQLKVLKDLVKRYCPDKYNAFFRQFSESKEGDKKGFFSYASYIGFNDKNGKKEMVAHSVITDDLYTAIKARLPLEEADKDTFAEKQPGDKEKLFSIKKAIENRDYLLRQNSKENGVLPYQLNLNERRIILENQSKFYPFLGEKDKDFNNPEKLSYRIESILKYKIPYFVGPLSRKATNSWIVRKEGHNEKITPWNFHDVVDEEATADGFRANLKNCCTRLTNEPTLPKQSLVYQRFILLNERNKWLINGSPITVEDKLYLIKEAYLTRKSVSKKYVTDILKRKYKTSVDLTTKGSGSGQGVTDEDFHASLSSWIALRDSRAFGPALLHDKKKQALAEQIIYDIATFENQNLRVKRLKKYPLTPNQIKYISGLSFKGWAKLSNKLLTGLTTERTNPETGEVLEYSIMDLRWRTNRNFEEILKTKEGKDYKFDFRPKIEELNGSKNENREDFLNSLYASPMRKRALKQTIDIVQELKKILKIDHFDSYFVESTRFEGEKKRTKSRKDKILALYKESVKQFRAEFDLENLKNVLKKRTDGELNSKKLYLYFRQAGKSLYTGEPIDLNELSTAYDIDHIIPQAKVKDDSFRNTVLVEKSVNNKKQDRYPIPADIRTPKGISVIKALHSLNNDLRPKDKRDRLLRSVSKPLTDDELSGFVQRQLVSTNQSVKAVCKVLKWRDKDAKVVYSKAKNVSEFRQVFDLVKSREANDFHHAHDAYLNIVVGNVYDKVFSTGDSKAVKHKREYLEARNRDTEYRFKHDERRRYTDTLVWKAKRYEPNWHGEEVKDSEGTIDKVRKYLSYQDPLVTQMRFTNVGEHGFFKISLHTAKEGNAAFPIKQKGPFAKEGWQKKYGGYNDRSNPYASLVRSEGKKGKHIYSIEFVPTVIRLQRKGNPQARKKYLTENNKLKNPEVLIEKLLRRTILQIPYKAENGKEGYVRLGISGKTESSIVCINRSELHIPAVYRKTIKKISKRLGLNNQAGEKTDTSIYEKFGSNDIDLGKGRQITRDELKKLYDYRVKDVYCRPEYEGLPRLGTTIKSIKNYSSFDGLSTLSQRQYLAIIVKFSSCKSVKGTDLGAVIGNGYSKSCGEVVVNTKLIPQTKIIQTSTTGLVERVLFTVPED